MAIYTYIGNLDPSNHTGRILLQGGAVAVDKGSYADFTTAEYNLLSQQYNLAAGIVAGAPPAVQIANPPPNVAASSFIPFQRPGVLSVGVGAAPWVAPRDCTLVSLRGGAGTAPTGQAIIADLNKNGTTMYSTQGHRPSIAAAATDTGDVTLPDTVAISKGDHITIDIDQIGSIIAGADFGLTLEVQ